MDELERFKSEINLAEVAEGYGYTLDPRESSRGSLAMRRASDGDKIVVATAPDGHGVYFSVRDDQDNGSVIDFVMRRDGVSLGRVRQILRPWLTPPVFFLLPAGLQPFLSPYPSPATERTS
ncbi:MAG: hypothetical protein HQK96_09290 [Nitrospirae bacterium]|nr:hypothetical protein [Nitrospirota bacterium]